MNLQINKYKYVYCTYLYDMYVQFIFKSSSGVYSAERAEYIMIHRHRKEKEKKEKHRTSDTLPKLRHLQNISFCW